MNWFCSICCGNRRKEPNIKIQSTTKEVGVPKNGGKELNMIQERNNEENSQSSFSADDTFIIMREDRESALDTSYANSTRIFSLAEIKSIRRVC